MAESPTYPHDLSLSRTKFRQTGANRMDPHSGATKWAVVDFDRLCFFLPRKNPKESTEKKGSQGRDLMNGDFRQVEGMMMLAGKRRAWDTA